MKRRPVTRYQFSRAWVSFSRVGKGGQGCFVFFCGEVTEVEKAAEDADGKVYEGYKPGKPFRGEGGKEEGEAQACRVKEKERKEVGCVFELNCCEVGRHS